MSAKTVAKEAPKPRFRVPGQGQRKHFLSFNPDNPRSQSRTRQSFKDECDVNKIMAKFEKTALVDHVNERQGQYGDFTNLPSSFHEAIEQVRAANAMFLTLPSKVRKKFGNDPGVFLEFVSDPDNAEGMRELGLIPPSPAKPKVEPEGETQTPQAAEDTTQGAQPKGG